MSRRLGEIGPNMGVGVPRAPVGNRSPELLKSLVTGPSLLVNCYLEIKFHKKNQSEPGPGQNPEIWPGSNRIFSIFFFFFTNSC